jgi:hypothetical protein
MKKTLSIAGCLLLASCGAKTPIKPTQMHPDFGQVTYKHEAYRSARKNCKMQSWSKGITYEGKKITDVEKVERYADKYIWFKAKEFKNNLLFVGIETEDLEGKWAEAERLNREVSACMKDAGWKRIFRKSS